MDTKHLIQLSYALTDDQNALNEQQIVDELESDKPAWIDLYADHPQAQTWLEKHVDYLDPIIIEALLEDETRPRCEVLDTGVLLILRGVNLNEGAIPEDMVSLRMWIDPHRIITIHKRGLRALDALNNAYKKQKGPQTSQDFIHVLIEHLLNVMEPVLDEIEDTVDDLEDTLIGSPNSSMRHDIAMIRRRALQLKRFISPQREAISKLRNAQLSWITQNARMELHEHYDRITRFVEHLDATRERCQIIQDELSTILADKLNRNTYTLTLIAAIFMPLGFITGLLGINVGGMPGVDNPYAFIIVCALCAVLVVVEYALFKKLKWF